MLAGFAQALSGCQTITIQARNPCFVNGEISLGATCANTITSETTQLTTAQALDMLEARPARPDPDHPDQTLPAHPPGVFQSADDYGEETTELETACRLLGGDCSYALRATVATHKKVMELSRAVKAREVSQ